MGKKIILKRDWDQSPKIYEDNGFSGYFVGREREVNLLLNEILSKKRGAVLVSGYRGVGKTSLVYKVLSEVLKRDKNILVVLMNAAQLEVESEGNKINPRNIIENLIRRLYTVTKNKKLKDDIKISIDKLYKKAVAEEFKLIERFIDSQRTLEKEEEERIREILIDEKIAHIVVFFTCWVFGASLILFDVIPIKWINNLLGLLFTFPVPYTINLIHRKRIKKQYQRQISAQSEELYQFDDRISNLEFDLEEVHKKLSESGKKLIYVIDELDKLDVEQVKEALKYFKNLFTLSDAIFIFVGGEEIYNLGLEKQGSDNSFRSKEYTYFTSRYFLTRPLYSDLEKFIDEIIENKSDLTERELEIFKRSLCFDAQNDFFDIKRVIRDRITSFEGENPIIEIDEGKLNSEYLNKARMHKAISILFEDKYMYEEHSKWIENEKVLRTAFNHAEDIINSFPGKQVADPTGDQIQDEFIRDLNGLLYRYGALKLKITNETTQNIRGIDVPIRNYNYFGHIPTDIPDRLDQPTEYERRFIDKFKEWTEYILAVFNAFQVAKGEKEITENEFFKNPTVILNTLIEWNYNVSQPFNDNLQWYNQITTQRPPFPYKREYIEQAYSQISNYILNFKKSNLPIIITRAIIQLFPNTLQLKNLQQNPNLFSGSAGRIKQVLNTFNPPVLFKGDYSRQILLIYDRDKEIKEILETLKDNMKTHRIVWIPMEYHETQSPGLHRVDTREPKKLEESLLRLYEELKDFLK